MRSEDPKLITHVINFGRLPQRHRRTDGRTDRRMIYDSYTVLALRASRSENVTGCSFDHGFDISYIMFKRSYLGCQGALCSLKILLLEGDDSLLTLIHLWHTYPRVMPKRAAIWWQCNGIATSIDITKQKKRANSTRCEIYQFPQSWPICL